MANNSGRAKKIDLGNATWISLLSQCIDSIGRDQFTDTLLSALKSITDFDYSVSFAYHQNEKPICLFHTFSPAERVVFVDDYLKGPYLLDPFFKACGRKVDTGLYRLQDIAPDRFLQSEYYRSYYVRTGLAEEICYTFYLPNDVAVVISLMRSGESQRFSAREFRLLESVVPIVSSLAQRHWQAVPDWFEVDSTDQEPGDNPTIIENTVGAVFGPRITPRETQVVAQVLEGHSSESIAKSLGISAGTVRIHRRNIYAKLDISSQQELFSIFFQKIRTVRT
ncbi:MAG: helix-turn-helix transcriptional regulator [Gammaproteobacteria bacterium]|nr:helix-turn-helix transcriptional regulator [Gammaproteobacteria bacterium]MDH3859491.1 helix-turn-helix transcriptional regulator [Gammaproteobacteria bacterium]